MVTREQPPYPATPIKTSSFHVQDAHSQLLASASDSDTPSRPWAIGGAADEFGLPAIQVPTSSLESGSRVPQASERSLPVALQAGAGRESESGMERSRSSDQIPESLRPGPSSYTPRTSQEEERLALKPTNPFRKQHSGQSASESVGSSTEAWGESSGRPPAPTAPPPPPPILDGPISDLLGDLSLDGPNSNPWEPIPPSAPPTSQSLQTSSNDSATNAWDTAPPSRSSPRPPVPVPVQIEDRRSSISSEDSDDWNEERTGLSKPVEPTPEHNIPPINEEQNAWEESYTKPQISVATKQAEIANQVENNVNEPDGWRNPGQSNGLVDLIDLNTDNISTQQEEIGPPLPPRRATENLATHEPPRSSQNNEKLMKETYDIKKVRWQDATAASNPRTSPILVQNANGPCPLVALVNALTLSTPDGIETALVERLRSREQISLEFLLDAVIDELMSGRREVGQDLPVPSELYSFLITLHTGMNVNPMFFPSAPNNSVNDPRNSMSHVHPVERESMLPGTFEETREMKLYGTFSIPIIHGWIPFPGSHAFTALARSAKSYEDAQNIMFREEELEEKLSEERLSFEEQATLQDISTIKAFLSSDAPTQLTSHGLEIVTNSITPGSVAILFRNDHFSTLYRHPETMQLLQLVTDMGYAGHEEVVWQSLVDVNGENSEFFSGDFRIVGENAGYHSAEEEWTTVQNRVKNKGRSTNGSSDQQYNPPPGPPPGHGSGMQSSTEQEDHDLALALQLQEEEEQKQRDDVARRKRETEYSQRYIEQQAGTSTNNIPVTTNNTGGSVGRGKNTASPRNRTSSSASSGGLQTSGITTAPGRGRGNMSTTSLSPTSSRPVVPPRRAGVSTPRVSNANISRPQTNRPADPEAGEEAPPPSYEEASSAAAYIPPTNHPAHPSASPLAAAQAASNQGPSTVGQRRTGNFSPANGNVVYEGRRRGGGSNVGMVNEAVNSNGQPQQQCKKEGKDSCILM